MKKYKKIVLTGGPCSGKTTSIQKIEEEFTQFGYKVIIVPEAATILINSGIRPFGENGVSLYEFQKSVMELQMKLEEIALNNLSDDKETLIICDRGLMDDKAYVTKGEFKSLLEYEDKKEMDLMYSYDLVIHLRTAALGKRESYTLENNGARTETADEAIELDQRTLSGWIGHPKIKIIDNEDSFDDKINHVIKEIYAILDRPYPIQRQYKYLVQELDLEELKNIDLVKLEIEQYHKFLGDSEIIYRKTTLDGDTKYKAIEKKDTDNNSERLFRERNISKGEYLMNLSLDIPIRKIRYCFVYKNSCYRLDVFDDGLMILEIEETNKTKEVEIPPFIKIDRNITDDLEYRNSSIYLNKNKKKIKRKIKGA